MPYRRLAISSVRGGSWRPVRLMGVALEIAETRSQSGLGNIVGRLPGVVQASFATVLPARSKLSSDVKLTLLPCYTWHLFGRKYPSRTCKGASIDIVIHR